MSDDSSEWIFRGEAVLFRGTARPGPYGPRNSMSSLWTAFRHFSSLNTEVTRVETNGRKVELRMGRGPRTSSGTRSMVLQRLEQELCFLPTSVPPQPGTPSAPPFQSRCEDGAFTVASPAADSPLPHCSRTRSRPRRAILGTSTGPPRALGTAVTAAVAAVAANLWTYS